MIGLKMKRSVEGVRELYRKEGRVVEVGDRPNIRGSVGGPSLGREERAVDPQPHNLASLFTINYTDLSGSNSNIPQRR